MKRLKNYEIAFFSVLWVAQTTFIILKIQNVIEWNWFIIFLPLMTPTMFYLILWVVLFLFFFVNSWNGKRKLRQHVEEIKGINKEIEDILNDVED